MNKKGDISTTLTWIVSMFIIFFITILFIIGTINMSAKKKYVEWSENEIVIKKDILQSDLIIQRSLENFLNKRVVFQGKETTISEVARTEKSNEEATSLFKKNAEDIFSNLFPFPTKNWRGQHPWWFRIYDETEIPAVTPGENKFHAGGQTCNPLDTKQTMVFSYTLNEKKAILCMNNAYYETWRKNKHE